MTETSEYYISLDNSSTCNDISDIDNKSFNSNLDLQLKYNGYLCMDQNLQKNVC